MNQLSVFFFGAITILGSAVARGNESSVISVGAPLGLGPTTNRRIDLTDGGGVTLYSKGKVYLQFDPTADKIVSTSVTGAARTESCKARPGACLAGLGLTIDDLSALSDRLWEATLWEQRDSPKQVALANQLDYVNRALQRLYDFKGRLQVQETPTGCPQESFDAKIEFPVNQSHEGRVKGTWTKHLTYDAKKQTLRLEPRNTKYGEEGVNFLETFNSNYSDFAEYDSLNHFVGFSDLPGLDIVPRALRAHMYTGGHIKAIYETVDNDIGDLQLFERAYKEQIKLGTVKDAKAPDNLKKIECAVQQLATFRKGIHFTRFPRAGVSRETPVESATSPQPAHTK